MTQTRVIKCRKVFESTTKKKDFIPGLFLSRATDWNSWAFRSDWFLRAVHHRNSWAFRSDWFLRAVHHRNSWAFRSDWFLRAVHHRNSWAFRSDWFLRAVHHRNSWAFRSDWFLRRPASYLNPCFNTPAKKGSSVQSQVRTLYLTWKISV